MNKSISVEMNRPRRQLHSGNRLVRLAVNEVSYEIMRLKDDVSVKLRCYQFIVVIAIKAHQNPVRKLKTNQ